MLNNLKTALLDERFKLLSHLKFGRFGKGKFLQFATQTEKHFNMRTKASSINNFPTGFSLFKGEMSHVGN